MEEIQLSPEAIKQHKERQGFTDEQLKNLTLNQRRVMNASIKFEQYNIIAECVWAHGCALRPKPGDKFVFTAGGRLLPEESTFPAMCLGALARFLPFLYTVYERLAQGLDPSPIGLDHIKCADTWVENGGFGEVLFRIYCEQVSPERKPGSIEVEH